MKLSAKDKEKAKDFVKNIVHCDLCSMCNGKPDKLTHKCELFHTIYYGFTEGYKEGLKEGLKKTRNN